MRSIHSISEDTILVGGSSEIGLFIKKDIPGNFRYQSLISMLPDNHTDFGEIWQIKEHEGSFYLRSGKAVLQYTGDTIKILSCGYIVEHIQFVGDSFYIQYKERGLGIFNGTHFTPLPGGEFFIDKFVRGIQIDKNGRSIIFTRDNGIFFQEGRKFKPLNSATNIILQRAGIENVCHVNDLETAVGTIKDGLYIINDTGNILQHVSKANGLINNTILSLATDYKGNLWLGLDKGLAYLEINSPFSVINSSADIGTGYVSAEYDDQLYLGTNQGLFVVKIQKAGEEYFFEDKITPVQHITGQVWSLNYINHRLYSGQHGGTFLIEGNQAKKVNNLEGVWIIKTLISNPDLHLASTYRGFYLLKQTNNGGLDVVNKLEIPGNSREFMEDKQGFIWRTSGNNNIIRFKIDNTSLSAYDIEEYQLSSNGNTPLRIKVLGTNNRPIYATEIGIFEYNPVSNQFVRNDFFNNIFEPYTSINEIMEDKHNRIWFSSRDEIGYYTSHLGQVRRTSTPFEKIKRQYTHSFGYINVLSESDILFPFEEGFIHYNSEAVRSEKQTNKFRSYISLIDTHTAPEKWIADNENEKIPVFKHSNNSIQCSFTANSFESPDDVWYSYILLDFNQTWSPFSQNTIVNFTNLREGDYSLMVKARDIYGTISQPVTFRFGVLPPYYRSNMAFVFYGLVLILIFYLIHQLRQKQLSRERNKMELRKAEELEAIEREFEKERLIAKEQIIQLENERLLDQLKNKARDLSNSTLNIMHKNELLQSIKIEMNDMSSKNDLTLRNNMIRNLMRNIDKQLEATENLEVFDRNLNEVHQEFVERLKKKYPNLTSNDIRQCIFLKLNKTTKEIAALMNLSLRGVETSRYRLRKKMKLERNDNLMDAIFNI